MRVPALGRRLAAASLALMLPACASAPPASLVQARGDVADAIKAPADSYSRAELDEARLKLGQAEAAAKNDDMDSAGDLSQESIADLRLSRARAEAQHSQKADADMQATINSLQSEVNQPPIATSPPPPTALSPPVDTSPQPPR